MRKENKFFIIVLFLITISVLYFLQPILTPFFAGALLAYLADPLVTRLISLKLSRVTSSVIVFSGLFLILTLLVPGHLWHSRKSD
jgi:predicted PurR-regulated permease PerM